VAEQAEVVIAGFDELDPRTAYELWRLRIDVFVVEQECTYPELDGRDLEPATRHLWVEAGSGPAAYLRLLSDPGGVVRVGRVCVRREERGRGLAAVLMHAAVDRIGESESVLNAQSYLAGWYERFGYEVDGPEFLDDGIPHVPMRRPGTPR